MSSRILKFQVCSEILVAAVLGCIIVYKSYWGDPDEVIAPCWHVVLFGMGVVFGFLGRCPVWLIGPAAALVLLLAAVMNSWAFGFELVMFALLATLVSLGAATGRWARRYRDNRKIRNAP